MSCSFLFFCDRPNPPTHTYTHFLSRALASLFSCFFISRKNNLQQKRQLSGNGLGQVFLALWECFFFLLGSIHKIIWKLFHINVDVRIDLLHNWCQVHLPALALSNDVTRDPSTNTTLPRVSNAFWTCAPWLRVFSNTGNLIRNYYKEADFGPRQ